MKTINDIIQLLRSYEPYKTDEQLVEFLSELISDYYAKVNLNNDEIVFPWNPGECTSSDQKFEAVDVNLLFNTRHRDDDTMAWLNRIDGIQHKSVKSFESLRVGIIKGIVDDLIIKRFLK